MCAFLGNEARWLVKRVSEDPTVVCFLTASATTYKKYMPRTNFCHLTQAFAATGPCMIFTKKDSVMNYLILLHDLFSVLFKEETKLYEIQERKIVIDNTLPTATDANVDDVDIVKWYSHLSRKYLLSIKWPCWYFPLSMDPR